MTGRQGWHVAAAVEDRVERAREHVDPSLQWNQSVDRQFRGECEVLLVNVGREQHHRGVRKQR